MKGPFGRDERQPGFGNEGMKMDRRPTIASNVPAQQGSGGAGEIGLSEYNAASEAFPLND